MRWLRLVSAAWWSPLEYGELLELGEGRFDAPLVAGCAACPHGEQSGGIRSGVQLGPPGECLDPRRTVVVRYIGCAVLHDVGRRRRGGSVASGGESEVELAVDIKQGDAGVVLEVGVERC